MIHNSLPFSTILFFQYMFSCILLLYVAKFLISKIIPYKILLSFISFVYIAILFPKPFHILGLIVSLYLILLLLRKYYKHDNIILPVFLLSIPIILMKIGGAFPINPNSDFLKIIRIAGLSYMVFKVIGLYIEQRRNTSKIYFVDFFNFTAFVPTLLIGPLDRFGRFKKDTENGYSNMNSTFFNKGLNNLILGLLFKFICAETIRRLILVYFFIFFFLNSLSFANSLSKEEEKYFNFLDLNNDNQISLDEMYRALRLVFQLIDENNDEIISKEEVLKLKNIIESLS